MMQSKHKSVISTGLFLIPKEEQMLVGHRSNDRLRVPSALMTVNEYTKSHPM